MQSVDSWYRFVNKEEPLEQGDILFDFPVLIIPNDLLLYKNGDETFKKQTIKFGLSNVVIISQSCDIQYSKDEDMVITCALYDYSSTTDCNKDGWSNLVKGRVINKYLLKDFQSSSLSFEYQVVDLRNVISTNYSLLKEYIQGNNLRLRILSPYKEHLAFHFAYQFMRIGLPSNLPKNFPF